MLGRDNPVFAGRPGLQLDRQGKSHRVGNLAGVERRRGCLLLRRGGRAGLQGRHAAPAAAAAGGPAGVRGPTERGAEESHRPPPWRARCGQVL